MKILLLGKNGQLGWELQRTLAPLGDLVALGRQDVDIEAADALIRRIAPAAGATRRPGTDAELGGFGGLFDLRATGYSDPILVASTDGVGTKLKLAIEARDFSTIGQTGLPVTRSKTYRKACLVGWATALIFFPSTVTSSKIGGDGRSTWARGRWCA